ncbi:tetratricopeptide repeat protein [Sutcliffiella cohnii]
MSNRVIEKAMEHILSGDTETGLSLLKKNEKSFSDEEKYNIAHYYTQLGLINEAKSIFQELVAKYPTESELLISLAEVYIDADEDDEAVGILETVSKDDESYPQTLMLLADLYQAQGLLEVSERKLLEAKNILPSEPIIDVALGETYLSMGDYKKAIPYFVNAKKSGEIVDFPFDERLAECYSSTGQWEEAMPYYDNALKKELNIDVLFQYAFTAFQAGYFKTAIEKFREVRELDYEYASVYLYLAKALEHENLLEESFQVSKDGLAVNEYNKELQLFSAKMALKLQNFDEAEKLLREAIALDPGYLEAALTLTKLLLQEERFDDVVECIEELEKFGETDPQFDWDLALAKEGLEQYSDALNYYRQAYTSFKDNSDFLQDYAYFLLQEGLLQEAKPLFKVLLQEDPTNIELQDVYSRLEE